MHSEKYAILLLFTAESPKFRRLQEIGVEEHDVDLKWKYDCCDIPLPVEFACRNTHILNLQNISIIPIIENTFLITESLIAVGTN